MSKKTLIELTEILENIIAIPSWVDKNTNEIKLGNWIVDYLQKNTGLSVAKQDLGNGRFNVIAGNSKITDTLVVGHIDTVQPNLKWDSDPLEANISQDKLFGLGSSDMKCGIAVMLYLSKNKNLTKNTSFLFYCDEEYDFLGMKKYISEYKDKINPKLIISLDGDGLEIGNSCRGLIEMKITCEGKSGHAARPSSGISAITESQKVLNKLSLWLKNYRTKELGNSTLNIAYFNGGTKLGSKDGKIQLGREGNIIANYAEYIVEIRVASEKLDANTVRGFLEQESNKLGLNISDVQIRHDLGSWITQKEKLSKYVKLVRKNRFKNAKECGYLDIQMLWKEFGKTITFSLGAGEAGQPHKENEYVKISSIVQLNTALESILIDK